MGKATGGTRQAALRELTNAPRVAVNTKVMPLNFTVLLPLLISHFSNGGEKLIPEFNIQMYCQTGPEPVDNSQVCDSSTSISCSRKPSALPT